MILPRSKLAGWEWLSEKKGFQLIKLARNSKVPVRGEQVSRSTKRSFEDVRLDRNANAGVLTGRLSRLIVLDIDDHVLFPTQYHIPDTFTVKTGKGFHHYFTLPDNGIYYRNRSKKELGFDIRAEGGYVVAPWSKHPTGSTYTLLANDELAEAPKWLLDIAVSTDGMRCLKENECIVPQLTTISEPQGFSFPPVRKDIIEEPTKKGKRSERIWQVLNELIEVKCSDEDILFIFESHPQGIGEKYFETGARRRAWLMPQIEKVREEDRERYVDTFEAKDQSSVDNLVNEIVSFIGKGAFVSEYHRQS
ncbi:bifunctional DNA primase/polymerase [Thermodesulfobacteriota bacterium]